MRKRGGGILSMSLKDKTLDLKNYFQISVCFETINAMGANFINSCLEKIAETLKDEFLKSSLNETCELNIIMSIMSNYVPNCLVKSWVSCPLEDLNQNEGINGREFAEKFINAVNISNKLNIPIVFISTAGIFDGEKKIYDESDLPNPTDAYSKSKLKGEVLEPPHLTIRTSIIGTEIKARSNRICISYSCLG